MSASDESPAERSEDSAESVRKRLAETQRQLRLTEQLAHIGFWRVDTLTNELHWSDEVFRIHGLTRESYTPTVATAIAYYHPDDRQFVRDSVARAIENKEPFDFELRLVRADGEVRQVVSKGRPELDENGEVFSVVGIFQDVTEQKHAELERRRSLERLRVHVEHTPLGVVEWDTDFRIVEWNARCEEMFGFSRREALGRRGIDLIVPPEARPRVLEVFAELLEQRGGTHNVNENITKDGRVLTCDWHNTTLVDEEGRPNGVASICQDITERQRLESQVAQAQKMEAIGTLAGGIAHDMNNVLAVVLGLGSILVDTFTDADPRQEDMREILLAAKRGKSMVTNLLDFARRVPSTVTRWSPGGAIGRLMELLAKTVPKELTLRSRVDDDVGDVMADADQMATALMNLCINAAQATAGRGTLTLTAGNVSLGPKDVANVPRLAPGPYVRLQVIDDGVGMDEATRARACEPFFTTKPVGEGTGLGLATVYGVVEQHGGRVTLESTEGHGTTVSMYLPAAPPEDAGELAAPDEMHVGSPTGAPSARKSTVLVIDDEAMIVRTARRLLEALGHHALVAQSAETGLETLATNAREIDVVLLDLSMPRMNGVECMAEIHSLVPDMPVVICTGHGGPDRGAALREAGAVAVLHKPFGRPQLAQTLDTILSQPSPTER